MKIYISSDMEGIGGVITWEQACSEGAAYDRAVALQMGEINAAVDGAIAAGAQEVVVADSHWHGRNFRVEQMDPRAAYYTGTVGKERFPGLDSTFAGMFLVGYHPMAGTVNGVLSHTWFPELMRELRVNGILMGEVGLEALWAGRFGVPVLLVTGDEAVCNEAKALLGEVETAAVKVGVGRYRAKLVAPEVSRRLIREAAVRAMKKVGSLKPFRLEPPYRVECTLNRLDAVDAKLRTSRLAKRVDAYALSFESDDIASLLHEALEGM